MKFSVLALLLPFVGDAAARLSRRQARSANVTASVAKSFIVEYAAGSATRRENLESTDGIKVVKTFDSSVFSGASVETETHSLRDLEDLPGVLKVWPDEVVYLDRFLARDVSAGDYLNYTTHNATGVSKLHDEGIFGKGVKVGIVDTGVWYYHPALGGGFGPGYKVAGGADLVGDGLWPYEGEVEPDSDPLDQQGHGTHVSGIIAGQNDWWSGVAPEATLYMYKVFTQVESTTTSILIEAFLAAYNDGVDIITSSIGVLNGWSDNAWAVVSDRLVEEGVVITIAAGNSGSAGPFYASSGSSGKNVLAIASVETELFPSTPYQATLDINGTSTQVNEVYFPSDDAFPSTISDWPIVSLSLDPDATSEACSAYPAGTRNLTGVIPLVRRGECTFQTKQGNLEALGAEYILIYNDDVDSLAIPSTGDTDSMIALIPADSGKSYIQTLQAGGNVTADFSNAVDYLVSLAYPEGNRPNSFTSWGGLYDLQLKPDIAAPGGDIYSTYMDDTYKVISGTSMACPYVAGVAALYIGKYGGRSVQGNAFAKALSRRIIASGTALPWSDDTATDFGYDAPPAQVGNGLVNAYKIVHHDTDLQFDTIALNDTRYFSGSHDITVSNNGTDSITYTLSVENGAGVETVGWYALDGTAGTKQVKEFDDLVPQTLAPEVELPSDFTLEPGESKVISVTFSNPETLGWNSSALPLYGGRIVVSGSNGDQLSVPYMGLASDLKAELDTVYQTSYPKCISTTDDISISSKSYYTFNLSVEAQDFPRMLTSNLWGTREMRWDIFDATWTEEQWEYPPVVGQQGYIGSAAVWEASGVYSVFDPSLYDASETYSFPLTNMYRDYSSSYAENWWFGLLSNGSQIAIGNYTMRFASLKPFGDKTVGSDWDTFTSEIGVLGSY